MKYKLTDEIIVCSDITLHRIEALNDFSNVKKGDKGGFVESADNLSQNDSAWVSGNARVYGDAVVYGNALVSDNAVVSGNALVSGDAVVSDKALVSGFARVYGDAVVYGNAVVSGNALVCGNALVSGDAWVYGDAVVSGDAVVYGEAQVSGEAVVYGEAQVSGEAQVISIPFLSEYKITITDNHIKIGCKQHTIEQWRDFEDDEIAIMDDGALEWWEKHKDFIFMAIELRN